MIEGLLATVVGPDVPLNPGTFAFFKNQNVRLQALDDKLSISGSSGGAPHIYLDLDAEFLLSLIGKGGEQKIDGRYQKGKLIRQEGLGFVDFQVGMGQRDHMDRHLLQSVLFTYLEDYTPAGQPRGFTLLFDIQYGELADIPRNGCRSLSERFNISHMGNRVWIRADCPWSNLYDFHCWARSHSNLPGDLLRERLGVTVSRPEYAGPFA